MSGGTSRTFFFENQKKSLIFTNNPWRFDLIFLYLGRSVERPNKQNKNHWGGSSILVRAPACHAGGCEFKPRLSRDKALLFEKRFSFMHCHPGFIPGLPYATPTASSWASRRIQCSFPYIIPHTRFAESPYALSITQKPSPAQRPRRHAKKHPLHTTS